MSRAFIENNSARRRINCSVRVEKYWSRSLLLQVYGLSRNAADLARSITCMYVDLHAGTVSYLHADYLEFHLTHATDGNTVTTRRKQKQLFLQFQ